MKGMKKILTVMLVFAMILTIAVPQATDVASAASKKYVQGMVLNDGIDSFEYAPWFKINGGYYTMLSKYDDNWNLAGNYLYYKSSEKGTPKKIYTAPEGYQLSQSIVTNGSKVYFASFKEGKFKIHQASVTGKTKKTLKTKTIGEGSWISADVFNYYNGNLYISVEGAGNNAALYTYNIESKKLSRTKKEFGNEYRPHGANTYKGQTRYLYGTAYDGETGTYLINVYDCKNKKTLRTIKNAVKMKIYDGKMYYLKDVDGTVSVYKGSSTGKDAKEIYTFPEGAYVSAGMGEWEGYYFANIYNEETQQSTYSKYNLETGETIEITAMEHDMNIAQAAGPF